MKRATIDCKVEYYFEGREEELGLSDPLSAWLILPDGDLFELTGKSGDDIKAHIWVSGGWLYKAKVENVTDEEARMLSKLRS